MSRLWKIGSIFSRLSGMIEGGHLKSTDIPIWYSIYKRFPPIREPRYLSLTEGDVPKAYEPPKLLYDEDIIRQAYYEDIDDGEIIKLKNNDRKSRSQIFIGEYFKLKSKQKSTISHSKLFRLTLEHLQQHGHPIMFKIGRRIKRDFHSFFFLSLLIF
jgi:small subunit ribosomal protein S23